MAGASRRTFLKSVASVSAATLGNILLSPQATEAKDNSTISRDRKGVLVDTTVCRGCRKCEWACKKAHNIEAGNPEEYDIELTQSVKRRPDHTSLTIVNQYRPSNNNEINVKFQCMHCDKPACASACIVGAFTKTESGAVTWDGAKCIGCRYCMVACPFQVPAFEYHKALEPRITKCDFCFERISAGKLPACVDICPAEALIFGKRLDLLKLAHDKIRNYPERYNTHVFGETEVGGTSWIYLSGPSMNKLGMPRLGNDPAPGVSESIQHGIFAYFIPPIALYALLGGIMWVSKNRETRGEE